MSKLAILKLILTLTCEHSTRLVSQSLDGRLSRGERIAVRLHAISCRWCRRFARQINLLREALRHREQADADATGLVEAALSPEARKRIRQVLSNPPTEK
ncbi:MAG: anti-sigma factor family protein [Planctomycetota bacterium]|jgi:hypothetical protein